jgi:hypothetical protein
VADPSPPAVAAIRARVAAVSAWTKADAAVLADLMADAVANPVSQGQVPKGFTASDLVNACAAGNRPGLAAFLNGAAAGLIVAQDAGHLAAGMDALVLTGNLAAADVAAMKDVMTRAVPDPAWPATVPAIQVTIGRPIDLLDVAASRPGT